MQIFKVSELRFRDKHERAYVVFWIKHPDKGSAFERNTRLFRWLPGWVLLIIVNRLKYNGLIFYEGENLIDHVFYQEHPFDWKMFSISVSPDLRQRGYTRVMLVEFLNSAYRNPLLTGVRIGAGGDSVVEHLWKKALDGKLGLSFSLRAGNGKGALEFIRPKQATLLL